MNKKFKIEEIDTIGFKTLEAISEADRLNSWMYSTIRPYCFGNVLEIGSGIGNISEFFVKDNFRITLSDLRDNYLRELSLKFPDLEGIINLDLIHNDFDNIYGDYFNCYDTIFALNVIEHIEFDKKAIGNCWKLLKKGGSLIILVPAYNQLYNHFDHELGHYRRYTKKSLNELFKNKFQIINSKYFNAAGILGWFVSGYILKNKSIPRNQVGFFNSLVPIFKSFDRVILNSFGLSVITVGRKY